MEMINGSEMTGNLPWNTPDRVALPVDDSAATTGIDGQSIWIDAIEALTS